jgi:hypothetical protein
LEQAQQNLVFAGSHIIASVVEQERELRRVPRALRQGVRPKKNVQIGIYTMVFMKEHLSLYKTALSDLQGSWQNLRDEVVNHHPFQDSNRLLFQIDEGMSWEAVRDLEYMRKTLLIIRNIAAHAQAPSTVAEGIECVLHNMEEVFEAINEGEIG